MRPISVNAKLIHTCLCLHNSNWKDSNKYHQQGTRKPRIVYSTLDIAGINPWKPRAILGFLPLWFSAFVNRMKRVRQVLWTSLRNSNLCVVQRMKI